MSRLHRVGCAAVAALAMLSACVPVDDDRQPREPVTAGNGGAGGGGGGGGRATGGSAAVPSEAGGQGGSGGLDPANPIGGNQAGAGGLPAPDVDAIFEAGCATAPVEAELPEVNLLFVLDRSESMVCNPPPTTSSTDCEEAPSRMSTLMPSKWEITREALGAAINALPVQTLVGISYFSNDDGCGVNSRPRIPLRPLGPTQVAAINASLSTVTPAGATPIVGATILAYRHLHEQALAGKLHGERFVVLLTDGEQSATCSDPDICNGAQDCTQLLEREVGKASGPGVRIRTFVIGVPGTDNDQTRTVLSKIAKEGLTAPADCDPSLGNCHFDMTKEDFGTGLARALEQIVGRALTCDLPLPEAEIIDPELVNVVYSSSLGMPPRVVPRDDTAPCEGGAQGWQYLPDGKSIRLCGDVCNEARKDQAGRMDVVLGCPVQGPD